MAPRVHALDLARTEPVVRKCLGQSQLHRVEGRLSKRNVQEDWIESCIQYAVQEICAGTGWTNLRRSCGSTSLRATAGKRWVRSTDGISSYDARQSTTDIAQLIQAVRSNIVCLEQKQIAQLTLNTKVPALRIRGREFGLKLVVPRQSKDDRQ